MANKFEDVKKHSSPVGDDFDEVVIEELRNDVAFRETFIKRMVSEKDPFMLVLSLQKVVEAVGGVGAVAEATGLNRTALYRTLSGEVSPDYISLTKILAFVGVHFTVERNKKPVAFKLETKMTVINPGAGRRAVRGHKAHA